MTEWMKKFFQRKGLTCEKLQDSQLRDYIIVVELKIVDISFESNHH